MPWRHERFRVQGLCHVEVAGFPHPVCIHATHLGSCSNALRWLLLRRSVCGGREIFGSPMWPFPPLSFLEEAPAFSFFHAGWVWQWHWKGPILSGVGDRPPGPGLPMACQASAPSLSSATRVLGFLSLPAMGLLPCLPWLLFCI